MHAPAPHVCLSRGCDDNQLAPPRPLRTLVSSTDSPPPARSNASQYFPAASGGAEEQTAHPAAAFVTLQLPAACCCCWGAALPSLLLPLAPPAVPREGEGRKRTFTTPARLAPVMLMAVPAAPEDGAKPATSIGVLDKPYLQADGQPPVGKYEVRSR